MVSGGTDQTRQIQAKQNPPSSAGDWTQIGHDPQHTNATSVQVDPPYCYAWKWVGVPFASRAQPVIAGGRLFMGGMDGILYARDASNGTPLWQFSTRGPIRHSPAVYQTQVIVSSHDGYTYALDTTSGKLAWRLNTGPSQTAPLIDPARGWGYIASTAGRLSALDLQTGKEIWRLDAGAPILTTPALSVDGKYVYLGDESIRAFAVDSRTGKIVWQTPLQGQSLADRYPVVAGESVVFRSQPIYFFHDLLHEGDEIMDQAGALQTSWPADWQRVKPRILAYLNQNPDRQTFFILDARTGKPTGVAPVLYTYGNNDIPNLPVIRDSTAFLTYRARHGIQTDNRTVHVTSKYDAELGRMDLRTLEIQGLTATDALTVPQFRMTSDEPAMLSMGGDILWVDNWERLGGIHVNEGKLVYAGNVSNDWPECGAQCGPVGPNPFFPLSGQKAYPFPTPRIEEGSVRAGAVIANRMVYWRVIESGLAALAHSDEGQACPSPKIWNEKPAGPQATATPAPQGSSPQTIESYLSLDLSRPAAAPPGDLVLRVRREVRALLEAAGGDHLLPFYLERGFSTAYLWPGNTTSEKDGLPAVTYQNHGNIYWYEPGELLYTLALAYPYLDRSLQDQVHQYMKAEMERYPPLQDLPWNDPLRDWLRKGSPRERYQVPFRSGLNNWPPPAASLSSLYALWLWSENSGDWSYARDHWAEAQALFQERLAGGVQTYADLAGLIGYYRLADHLEDRAARQNASQAALGGFRTGLDYAGFRDRAAAGYLDPRDLPTGWSAPVFFGITPEIGRYLADQMGGQPQAYLRSLEALDPEGVGVAWWYLTRAGVHAEAGETSYLAPTLAWSHFLAHAWILQDPRSTLRAWLDRPWTPGDLYSIQKVVAAIQARP